jgi:hypothetical protein
MAEDAGKECVKEGNIMMVRDIVSSASTRMMNDTCRPWDRVSLTRISLRRNCTSCGRLFRAKLMHYEVATPFDGSSIHSTNSDARFAASSMFEMDAMVRGQEPVPHLAM